MVNGGPGTLVWVSVDNPDDPTDMPIYEGSLSNVARALIDGTYVGHTTHDDKVTFTITGNNVEINSITAK